MWIKDISKLINTKYLVKYFSKKSDDDGLPENKKLFKNSSIIRTFVDDKVPEQEQKKYLNKINAIMNDSKGYVEVRVENINGRFFENKNDGTVIGYIEHNHGEAYVLAFKSLDSPDSTDPMESSDLTKSDGESFMIIGNIGSHPYIVTNTFSYGNSDGSGPDDFGIYDGEKMTPCNMIQKISKYFGLFCEDSFH